MSDPDEFDRIVSGLELDIGDDDLDAAADRIAAERRRAEFERERAENSARRAAQVEQTDDDDDFYREVGPATLPSDRRTRWAWLCIAAGPALLLATVLLPVRPPTAVVVTLVLLSVGGVVFLIARLPDRGPSNPDWPDDGAAL